MAIKPIVARPLQLLRKLLDIGRKNQITDALIAQCLEDKPVNTLRLLDSAGLKYKITDDMIENSMKQETFLTLEFLIETFPEKTEFIQYAVTKCINSKYYNYGMNFDLRDLFNLLYKNNIENMVPEADRDNFIHQYPKYAVRLFLKNTRTKPLITTSLVYSAFNQPEHEYATRTEALKLIVLLKRNDMYSKFKAIIDDEADRFNIREEDIDKSVKEQNILASI